VSVEIKLECLKLALVSKAHLDASEVIARAKDYESYVMQDSAGPSAKAEQTSGTSGQKPIDGAKDRKLFKF